MAVNLFDANFYRAANADLANFSDVEALSHFQNYGLNEGRDFSPLVNLNSYRSSNSDLASLNNQQAFGHLQNYGVAEGRRFSQLVDLNFYRASNSDLASFNNEQAFGHLQSYGVAEGRRFSQFADLNFYRTANSDLAGLNNSQALQHLEINGLNEGRSFSQFFDINYYAANNSDLMTAGLRNRQLLDHFEINGLREGRKSSIAFDANYYRQVNSDLAARGLNNQQLYEHFQLNGLREGRASSPVLDVSYYLAKNSDLVAAGFNKQQAYDHFVLYGAREGRIAQVPDYDITDWQTISGGSQFYSDLAFLGVPVPERQVRFEVISPDNRRNNGSQTWVISHGWNGSIERIRNLAGSVTIARPNDTVLVLDWQEAADTFGGAGFGIPEGTNYNAGTWIRPVADYAQRALTRWGIDPSSLNFIGHSLGAYVSSETAGVFVERNGSRVKSVTALDPASDTNLRLLDNRYDFDLSTDGFQGPRRFDAVANFSRSFIGRTSTAGDPAISGTASESIVLDFGLTIPGPFGGEHGWVVDTFQRLIDPNPNNEQPLLRLARNPLTSGSSPYLFSLDDYQVHSEFRQNEYAAGLGGGALLHEGIISVNPTNELNFFVATKADNPSDKYIYGTTGDDEILQGSVYYTNTNNLYFGDDGNDRIVGGTGNEGIYGGTGYDNLNGGDGRDTLDGARHGNPATIVLREIDTLTGGLGSDTFVLGDTAQSYYIGAGNDDYALITDFNPGGSEMADLAGIDFIQLKQVSGRQARTVGYYDMDLETGSASQLAPITTAGLTGVNLTDLTAADLSNIDVLFVQNPDNGVYGAEYLSRLVDIEAAVNDGMVLIIHDRFVEDAESILPSGGTFDIIRDFSVNTDINILNNTTLVTNGPGGVLDDTSLDGGNSSNHGFAVAGTLPRDASLILSRTAPEDIVTFSYRYGAGAVVYSTIPLDYYLDGDGPNPPRDAFKDIYAPNAVAYGASLFNPSYTLRPSPAGTPQGTGIFLDGDLIAVLQNVAGLNLNASYFTYV